MTAQPPSDDDVVALLPPLRRLTAALGLDPATSDDIVQETVRRLLSARTRMDRNTLTSYAMSRPAMPRPRCAGSNSASNGMSTG